MKRCCVVVIDDSVIWAALPPELQVLTNVANFIVPPAPVIDGSDRLVALKGLGPLLNGGPGRLPAVKTIYYAIMVGFWHTF